VSKKGVSRLAFIAALDVCVCAGCLLACSSQHIPTIKHNCVYNDSAACKGGVEGTGQFRRTVEARETSGSTSPRPTKTKEEILEYLRSNGLRYATLTHDLGVESLPSLYAILSERTHFLDWNRVATAIAYLGENTRSFEVLVDYVQRFDDWQLLPDADGIQLIWGKAKAFRLLGLAGGIQGDRLMASVLTSPEKTEAFLAKWIGYPIPRGFGDRSRIVREARCAAALGLVFTQRDEDIELVRAMHRRSSDDSWEAELATRRGSGSVDDNTRKYELYIGIVHAIAVNDYIKSQGLSDYLDKLPGDQLRYTLRELEREIEASDMSGRKQ